MEDRNNIATIAFPFMGGSPGDRLVQGVENMCRQYGIHGTRPKLGPHATVIPPFRCTEAELHLAAVVMRAMWKWKPAKSNPVARHVSAFEPPNGDGATAIYIEVEVSDEYHEFIEKHKLNWPLPFVHQPATRNPADRVWIPHITVLEGNNLHEKIEPHRAALTDYVVDKTIAFLEPHVMRKMPSSAGSYWQKVLV